MKTISIPDELYDFMVEMAARKKTQNRRCTADPLFFQIQKTVTHPTSRDYADDSLIFDGEDTYSIDLESIREIYEHYDSGIPDVVMEMFTEGLLPDIHEDDLIEELNKLSDKYSIVYSLNSFVYENCFITEEGIRNHMKANAHHYKESDCDYAQHAFRNPEMDAVIKLIDCFGEVKS